MNLRRMTNLCALSLCAILLLAGTTRATLLSFHANLDGLQVVPSTASTAFGSADVTLDDTTGVLTTSGSYTGLASTPLKIILFDGAFGTNGTQITPLFTNNSAGTTGTFSGGPTLSVAQIADMVAGNTYISIGNPTYGFTLGEIRGQLLAVPEPPTLALGVVGLCSLLVAGRRMRRKVA